VDQVCTQFERAWQGPVRPRIEDFVSAAAESDRSVVLRELILLDVEYRSARGEHCRAEDYQGRFPLLDPAWLASALAKRTTVTPHQARCRMAGEFPMAFSNSSQDSTEPRDRPMSHESRAGRDALPPSVADALDGLCDQFKAAWKTAGSGGERPRIEDYLGTRLEPERSALLRQLIALDIVYRQRAGEEPQPEEYQARFPFSGLCSTGQRARGQEGRWSRSCGCGCRSTDAGEPSCQAVAPHPGSPHPLSALP
jgi:hypothetical protein